MLKKALVVRCGAYGDVIHMSHLPHLLKDKGFDVVDVETNWKGLQLLRDNPFIDNILFFPECKRGNIALRKDLMDKHWEILSEQYDTFINLVGSIEYDILMMETQEDYYKSSLHRRKKYSNINFYDHMTMLAGYPEEKGKWTGELYFTEEEHDTVENYFEKYKDKFTIMMNVSGSSFHKQLVQAKEIAQWVLDKYNDCIIIETGGMEWKHLSIKSVDNERVRSIIGIQPFRQAALLSKYVNCVIGCESGIMVASNMWNTPTIQLMTAASLANHPLYARNDYSLQSPAYCSPCHKGPYQYVGCPIKDGYPLCVWFNTDDIKANIDKIYSKRGNTC